MADNTQHAFEVKTSSQYRRIRDEDLGRAAQYALLEAGEWDDAASVLQQYKNRFSCQICVMAMFSIELYLKAILMAKGINVTTDGKGHDIEGMILSLTPAEQEEIKTGITPSGSAFSNILGDYIDLDSFEKELKFISRDFIQLRYHYEKYMNGEPVYALQEFILALRDNVRKTAKKKVYH
nr:HEPN domain-containing protein [Clostridia bacterium]